MKENIIKFSAFSTETIELRKLLAVFTDFLFLSHFYHLNFWYSKL